MNSSSIFLFHFGSIACAPRYVFFSVSQSKKEFGDNTRQPLVGNRRDPVGTCWITNFTTSTEFSPCRTSAPEAQTSQPNVYRGGAVYRCDIAIDDSCIPVEFDRKENNYIKNPNPPFNLIQIDNKTLQWFGASVSTSSQDGGPILFIGSDLIRRF
ncbi:hypothetical protein PV327_008819 [Microctonus hyperodae]|uniref:Uncharacterized protein n=1 Tax=Microctonus hyperodae TaxID=165561 RepID=A0AA39FSI5_MICHY|nr:hypothetical protein PV327_008819 [Microctonus hyperodae]